MLKLLNLNLNLNLLTVMTLFLLGCSDGSNKAPDTEVTTAEFCILLAEETAVMATEAGIEYVRTPDECFSALVDYPYEPKYALVDGLRVHYVDEGPRDGEIVLMLHGQPSWSYLYRKMIPVLVNAGFRVIAPDHIGMGRSDKPIDPRVHIYDQQVAWNQAFIAQLELNDITLFVQDWGSLIGLQVAGEMSELFARIVVANGNLPPLPPGLNLFTVPVFEFDESATGAEEFFAGQADGFVEGFQQWIDYAASAPSLFAADVVQLISFIDIPEDELSAYNAPFPDRRYWGGIRAFPSMLAGFNGQTLPALAELGRYDRPFLFLAGELDGTLGSVENQNTWIRRVPGAAGQAHRRYELAHHFIQEDVGEEMAAHVVEFMQRNPIPESGPFFNFRYCEIFLLRDADVGLEAEVYATIGLNNCPQETWDAIDLDAVALEQGALSATENGPRYWLLDFIVTLNDEGEQSPPELGEVRTFGDLDMRQFATFIVEEGESVETDPYAVGEVARSTQYTYVAGRRIFELEDPDGNRYVMQSMSQQIDPELQPYDLIRLDERLDLPAGWIFRTRVLEVELQLRAVGVAHVVTDDLRNTYQMIE